MLTKVREKIEPQWALFSARFNRLEPRDQKMLLLLGVFLACMLLYTVIWMPIKQSARQAEQLRNSKQQLVEWLRSDEVLAHVGNKAQLTTNATPANKAPMASVINQTAQTSQITLKRFEPEGSNKLRVWLDDAPFNTLVLWLYELETRHAIGVSSLSLDNPQQNGRVSAKLVLEQQ